jgi:uncharacterized protein (TIGR02284 family)
MQRPADHDIKILNTLIGTTLDSADGYRQAALRASDARYRELFQAWANDRRRVVTELQSQLRVLGGTPDSEDAVLAAAERLFLTLRDSITRGDESVVSAVERGEGFIQKMYEEALDDEELSSYVRNAVIRAYGSVKAGDDWTRALKYSMQLR